MPDDKYNNGGQEPLWVEWDWLMQYERFRRALAQLLQPEYLFEDDAKANLTRFLREEGAFEGEGKAFNHISLPWRMWRRRAIQGKTLAIGISSIEKLKNTAEILDETASSHGQTKPDGFQCAIADTTIYALCSGRTAKLENGSWRVIVENVACFIHDGFDFNGDGWLGTWICEEIFDDLKEYFSEDTDAENELKGKTEFNIHGVGLNNECFQHFRNSTGYGCDFRTMCKPALVPVEVFSYDA